MRAWLNRLRDPVVKSCKRVPSASTRSASCAAALAAGEPVTPMAPRLSGWSQARLLLPACVSATGTPCLRANVANASHAWLYNTPPPATISGRRAARNNRAASARSRGSALGLRKRIGAGCRKSSGQSNAWVCTSCGSARHTGPQVAGSAMTAMAWGNADRICSARVIRSKKRVMGRNASLTLTSPLAKSSSCCNTGSGAREAKTSPGSSNTGSRLTCASAAAVNRLVAPGPIDVVTAITRWRNKALL